MCIVSQPCQGPQCFIECQSSSQLPQYWHQVQKPATAASSCCLQRLTEISYWDMLTPAPVLWVLHTLPTGSGLVLCSCYSSNQCAPNHLTLTILCSLSTFVWFAGSTQARHSSCPQTVPIKGPVWPLASLGSCLMTSSYPLAHNPTMI